MAEKVILLPVRAADGVFDGTGFAAIPYDAGTLNKLLQHAAWYRAARSVYPKLTYTSLFEYTPDWYDTGDDCDDDENGTASRKLLEDLEDSAVLEAMEEDFDGDYPVIPRGLLPADGFRTELTMLYCSWVNLEDPVGDVEIWWEAVRKHCDETMVTDRITTVQLEGWLAGLAADGGQGDDASAEVG